MPVEERKRARGDGGVSPVLLLEFLTDIGMIDRHADVLGRIDEDEIDWVSVDIETRPPNVRVSVGSREYRKNDVVILL